MTGPGDARFRELVEQAPDAFVLVDEDRIITYVNAFAEQLYGWAREELLGRPIDALVPERFRALLAGMNTSAIKPGARLGAGLELTGLRKDGSEFPVEINMMALPGERGLQVASVVRDVTRRRKMEERLAASEAKFRRVVEGLAGDYFFATLDRDGAVSYVSPSVKAILGYTAEELGRDFRGFLTDHPMNERASELLAQGFAGERPETYDLEVRHKDGSPRLLECTDTPVRGEDGVVI
ncbi:MAG: PAS domain-containing protein, partial [Myxococcota bacterium]